MSQVIDFADAIIEPISGISGSSSVSYQRRYAGTMVSTFKEQYMA
jgi:hypothetical protein